MEANRTSSWTHIPNSDAGIRLLDVLERVAAALEATDVLA